MNRIKTLMFSAVMTLTFFSCRTMKDENCFVPIILDSLNCYTNVKDTINAYKIDSLNFTIGFYYHLSESWHGDCMPHTYTTDYYSEIYILTHNKYLHFNPNDTINSICNQVIYYMPKKSFNNGNTIYLHDSKGFVFDKIYLCNINEILLQNENNPPAGIIKFKINQSPDSLIKLSLKCIIKLKTGKTMIKNFKPIKVMP